MWTGSTGAELVVDEKPAELVVDEKIAMPTGEPEAFQVDVVGRRSLCPIGVINPYPIAVEKLQIKRRLGKR